jgi:hypothetical protein
MTPVLEEMPENSSEVRKSDPASEKVVLSNALHILEPQGRFSEAMRGWQ